MAQLIFTLVLATLCSLSYARGTINVPLTTAGQNATWHTQMCSIDGTLICLTGVSNYVVDGIRYDATFQHGALSNWKPELLTLSPAPAPGTTLTISPQSLLPDAAGYLYINWNEDFLTQDSTIKATFANPDLSYKSDYVFNLLSIYWDTSLSIWQFGSNQTDVVSTGIDISAPYYIDGANGYFWIPWVPNSNASNFTRFWVVTDVIN